MMKLENKSKQSEHVGAHLALLHDVEGVLLGREPPRLEAVLDHVKDLIDGARPHVRRHLLPPLCRPLAAAPTHHPVSLSRMGP